LMSRALCKHLLANEHLRQWRGTDHTDPVQPSSIDPFAGAGWTGYPACRLAPWTRGDAADARAAVIGRERHGIELEVGQQLTEEEVRARVAMEHERVLGDPADACAPGPLALEDRAGVAAALGAHPMAALVAPDPR